MRLGEASIFRRLRFRKRILFLVLLTLPPSLLALYYGCDGSVNSIPTAETLSAGHHGFIPETAGDSLLIASYNIYLGRDIDQAIKDLQSNDQLANADVLFLQEMDPLGTEKIAQALHLNYVYWPSFKMGRTDRLFGNAVLSRWPIIGQEAVALPHEAPVVGYGRVAVAADIQIGPQRLRAVCVHFSTVVMPLEKRLEQVEAMLNGLASDPGPLIIGGDFNTVSQNDRRQIGRLMQDAGFSQLKLPTGPTAHSRVLDFTGYELILDHMFCRDLVPGHGGIDRSTQTSDHYPIWGSFTRPSRLEEGS